MYGNNINIISCCVGVRVSRKVVAQVRLQLNGGGSTEELPARGDWRRIDEYEQQAT